MLRRLIGPADDEKADESAVLAPQWNSNADTDTGKATGGLDDDSSAGLRLTKEPADQ
jgi:hypothetical protein